MWSWQESTDVQFISQLEKLVDAAENLRPDMEESYARLSASHIGDLSLDVSHLSNASRDRTISSSHSVLNDSASDSDSFVSAAEVMF